MLGPGVTWELTASFPDLVSSRSVAPPRKTSAASLRPAWRPPRSRRFGEAGRALSPSAAPSQGARCRGLAPGGPLAARHLLSCWTSFRPSALPGREPQGGGRSAQPVIPEGPLETAGFILVALCRDLQGRSSVPHSAEGNANRSSAGAHALPKPRLALPLSLVAPPAGRSSAPPPPPPSPCGHGNPGADVTRMPLRSRGC